MDFELVTVSKYASDIIDRNQLSFPRIQNLIYFDLLLITHEIYPTLYQYGDPLLYWQDYRDHFLRIDNYLTFKQMLISMADRKIYLLLEDCKPNGEETESFLRWLDYLKEKKEEAKKLTKYDVFLHKCKRKKPPPFIYKYRTNEEILSYALRNIPDAKCYTADTFLETKAAEYIRRGMPKRQRLRKMYIDEVIERMAPKSGKKIKDSKKGKRKEKGKKKK